MSRFSAIVAPFGALLLLSACGANYNAAYRLKKVEKAPSILTIDAKQRNLLIGPWHNNVARMCAEPSPDVFSVFAQSLGASISGGKASPQQIEAAASFAMSRAENGASISRTQTSNVVREMMYRTCERYLGGAITADQFAIQAIRDQRMVISVLAIEQLTGAVTPPTVVIRASGEASTGGAGSETVKLLADQQKLVRTADAAVADAAQKRAELDKSDPKCADLKDDETDAARKDKRTKCKAADEATKKATDEQKAAKAAYDDLRTASRQGGLPTDASTSTAADVYAGLNRASDQQVKDVTGAINNIINHLYGQDEFLLFCIDKLADSDSLIRTACARYVAAGVDAEARRLNLQSFDRAVDAVATAFTTDFDRFWAAVADPANPTMSAPAKAATLVASLRSAMQGTRFDEMALTAIGAAPRSRAEMQALFGRLAPAERTLIAR